MFRNSKCAAVSESVINHALQTSVVCKIWNNQSVDSEHSRFDHRHLFLVKNIYLNIMVYIVSTVGIYFLPETSALWI